MGFDFRSKSGSVEEFSSHNLSQNEPTLKSTLRTLHNQGNVIRKSIFIPKSARSGDESIADSGSRLNISSLDQLFNFA